MLSRSVPSRAAEAAAMYLLFLQGRGPGAGSDRSAEVAAEARLLAGVTRPTIVNVGANQGQWAAEMMAQIPDARWVLVEPSAACQPALRELAKSRPAQDVQVCAVALGVGSGHADLWADVPGSPAASVFQRPDGDLADLTDAVEQVSVMSLDDLAADLGLERIDLLKMDCEGSEFAVLRGAAVLLERRAIRVISFEFGSAAVAARVFFHDFWQLLSGSYRLSRVLPGGRTIAIDGYHERLEHFYGTATYLATAREP